MRLVGDWDVVVGAFLPWRVPWPVNVTLHILPVTSTRALVSAAIRLVFQKQHSDMID
jgi:hypothetical protein